MSARVAIVDSGGANIASLLNAFARLDAEAVLTNNADEIRNASHVVLPGVGTADDAMARLHEHQLADVIANLHQPVMGICLGMQLIAQASAEGHEPCLSIVPLSVEKLQVSNDMPVPNMGWCQVNQKAKHPLFAGIENDSYFYFAHSFAIRTDPLALATARHTQEFTAVFNYQNFYGAQFHPERSAGTGARFLQNFLDIKS